MARGRGGGGSKASPGGVRGGGVLKKGGGGGAKRNLMYCLTRNSSVKECTEELFCVLLFVVPSPLDSLVLCSVVAARRADYGIFLFAR